MTSGLHPDKGDYDRRTALHLAASEGLLEVVKFLIDEAGADPSPQDRWGNSPLDDAKRHKHTAVESFLKAQVKALGSARRRSPETSRSCALL